MQSDKNKSEYVKTPILISLCIPQYNRIKFLLHNLEEISRQTYPHLEIAISDDCSADTTQSEVARLQQNYKYPIRYDRFNSNQGYDRNLRHAIEIATGDYVCIIGNDDTINPQYDIGKLAAFLKENDYPDVGFMNFIDAHSGRTETRASGTALLGSGPDVAFKHYSRFSFVGGLVFKRSAFLEYNTSEYDGSIYSQIYHASLMIASGKRLFSIVDPVVIKDILPEAQDRTSYLDHIPRQWKDYKRADGGLPSVIHVLLAAFEKAQVLTPSLKYRVFKKIYGSTFPYWIVNYRKNSAFPAAIGLISGMRPHFVKEFAWLSIAAKCRVYFLYLFSSISALIVPVPLFEYISANLMKKVANPSGK